jgi:hypothetical protein
VKPTKSSKSKQRRVERLIPVVDEVVEMVFARLKEAAARAKKPTRKKSSVRSKGAAAHSSIAVNRDGLAGAVADLLLADLTQPRKPNQGKKRAKRRPRATPSRGRS